MLRPSRMGAGEGPHLMKLFSFTNLSLRTRFMVAMGIVFIPLVAVAFGSSVFLGHAASTLNRIVEQPVYKLQTTSRLQNQIRKTYVMVKDYALMPRYTLRSQFESEAQGVEAVFAEMLEKPFFGAQEQSL